MATRRKPTIAPQWVRDQPAHSFQGVGNTLVMSGEAPRKNPKGIAGAKKVPLHLFPTIGTILGALACEDGAAKYGVNNWRGTEIKLTDYISAISRHLLAIQDGEDVDPKSGVKHLGHIIASAAIVADAEECGKLIDDRVFPVGVAGRALSKYQRRD